MRIHLILIACLLFGAGSIGLAQDTPPALPEAVSPPALQEEAGPPGEGSPPGKPQITFQPANPMTDDRLKLRLKFGHNTMWAVTTWKRNGVYVGENRSTKEDKYVAYNRKLSAGDEIEASVVPFSPFSMEGEPVTIKVKVNKAPPDLKLISQEVTGQTYRAVVKVIDRDGGPIALSLKEAPRGMTISPDGKITWRIDPNATGRIAVVVSAKDKLGCEALMSYSFGVRRPGR